MRTWRTRCVHEPLGGGRAGTLPAPRSPPWATPPEGAAGCSADCSAGAAGVSSTHVQRSQAGGFRGVQMPAAWPSATHFGSQAAALQATIASSKGA